MKWLLLLLLVASIALNFAQKKKIEEKSASLAKAEATIGELEKKLEAKPEPQAFVPSPTRLDPPEHPKPAEAKPSGSWMWNSGEAKSSLEKKTKPAQ